MEEEKRFENARKSHQPPQITNCVDFQGDVLVGTLGIKPRN